MRKWFLIAFLVIAFAFGCSQPFDFVAIRVLNGSGESLLLDVSGVLGCDVSTLASGEYRDAEGQEGTDFFVWVQAADTTERLWWFEVPHVPFTFVVPPRGDW